ncbi:MAG: hypothetical protein J6U54_07750 [Clostridiales bacterium]|nr:hypothetical protein [Clostridiales bacterium]
MIFLGILIGIVVTFVFLQLIKVISRVCSIISERKEREQCRYEDMFNDIQDLKERVDKLEIKNDGYDRDVVCGRYPWCD